MPTYTGGDGNALVCADGLLRVHEPSYGSGSQNIFAVERRNEET